MVDIDARNDGASARRVSRLQRTPLERAPLEETPLEKEDMTPAIRREHEDARDGLKTVEDGAGSIRSDNNDAGASAAEKREQSGFYNSESEQDKTKASGGKDSKKGKSIGFFKKKGPMAIIFGLIFGGFGCMVGGQSLLPFSLTEQLRETFDSISISTQIRNETMWGKQLSQANLRNPLHQRYFGFGGTTFRVRSKQKQKLSAQGIYVAEANLDNNKTKTVMLFDDGSGKLKVVAAAEADIDTIKGLNASKIDFSGSGASADISRMDIDFDNTTTFRTAYTEIADFRNGYIAGSRTWRGSVSAWFDSVAVRFLKSNKITRNMFKNFQERVEQEQAGNTRSAAKKATMDAMNESVPSEVGITTKRHDADTEAETDAEGNIIYLTDANGENILDADGNPIPKPKVIQGTEVEIETSNSVKVKGTDKAAIRTKMNEIKNGKLGKASGYVSAGVNVACTIFDVIGAINLLLVAKESIDIIQVTTGFLEAVDKVKSGDGVDSPISVLAEGLVTPKATTVMQNTTNDESILESSESLDVEELVVDGREGRTAMQSVGIVSEYTGNPIDVNDVSVQNFNIGSRIDSIFGYLGNSLTSFAACSVAKLAAAVADMVTDVIAIASCVASFGIGCIVDALGQAGTSAGVSVAIGLGATFAINIIMPLAVKIFARDLISDLAGEDFGNALVSGANMYMGNNHLQGGGSLATYDKYVAYRLAQDTVIAEKAQYERETRSPFDITSQYTFMGNMLKQLATMYTLPSSMFGFFGGVAKMISSSIMAILPSASAYDLATTVKRADDEEFAKNCPFLSSIDAVGDAFCNPYMTTDMSTIGMDPLDIVDKVYELRGLDDDGSIKKGSNLARYVAYCNRRESAFGVADNNIASNFAYGDANVGDSTANTVINGAIGAVPVVGDLLDAISNSGELVNTGWITGQSCVASDDELISKGYVLGVSWSENMYYQRFVEDQRLMESIDPEYESVVTAFLDEYDKEHPLDNSYEGILARKSGLSKETVIALLDTIEYWDYIAHYDASTRYAFGAPAVEKKVIFDNDNSVAENTYIITLNNILYADVRNRSFAV